MKFRLCASFLVVVCAVAGAQVASHAPTAVKPQTSAHGQSAAPALQTVQATGKPVAKVNGAVLTDRDLLREMYLMFPYAQQHNGFPKELEPQIRQGALQMIIFEELLYQEGNRRKVVISNERVTRAMAQFRKTFPNEAAYQEFLKQEVKGSSAVLRSEIRRSFIIEKMLQTEIAKKAVVTPVAARAYYDKNALKFQRPETFHFQSISIIPPNDTADVQKEVKRRADEALKQAKSAKTYREFGLLAEKLSDDDYRVKMGDRQPVEKSKLPPEVVKAASAMQPGQVSDLIKLGPAYTIIRLEAHKPAGKIPFDEVKSQLQSDLQKERTEKLRSALGKQLRAKAKIELL